MPIVEGGTLDIVVGEQPKTVRLTRAHLEEDAGKSLHEDFQGKSGIDLNRAGTPLLEIVTEPDMRSAEEAVAYAKTLHTLVRWIGICDGNMQEGSFRCDANVSVRPAGSDKLGTRCEIKNLNSFRFMEQAIKFEVRRQIEIIEDGGTIRQETRLYDPDRDETRAMRSKEDAMDYRYFPDPDLLPLEVGQNWMDEVAQSMPELPAAKYRKLTAEFGLAPATAAVITGSIDMAQFFEATAKGAGAEVIRQSANWIAGALNASLNHDGIAIAQSRITSQQLRGLVERIADGTISGKIAKDIFDAMWKGEAAGDNAADAIIEKRGLKQISDSGAIEKIIDEVLAANAQQVADYKSGKEKAFNSLVGQVMKASKGKANPAQVNALLKQKLGGN